MDPSRWQRIQELFNAATDLPAVERTAFLQHATDGDISLYRQVHSLIVNSGQTDGFLEAEIRSAAGQVVSSATSFLAAGDRLGPYEIVREIGQGGMGAVFLAVRADDAYRKQVAIKLVRHGWLSNDLLDRFRNERQILANLDHPNIARLFDGGATPNGLPYVVMEYVDGVPLDRYCESHNLSIEDRLRLFQQVCSAVEYAHRNLVVHRDIKPGNILVSSEGVPKLLDFGIAKLLTPQDGAVDGLTRANDRLMTPEYASPEQILGQPVTTASDIYSLGALLFELLTGNPPHRFTTNSMAEIERAVTGETPRRPSEVVHATDPRRARGLEGDLDNIILKAIHKEPTRRFGSVSQFSEDIERYLTGYPVHARPDSWRYRAGKFVRRHKIGVAVAALFLLSIAGFSAGMAYLARKAQREAHTADQVAQFMEGLFQVSDPSQARGNTITAREILDQGAARVETELAGQPEIKSRLMASLGNVYLSLGFYDQARQFFEKALETRKIVHGANSVEVGEMLALVAVVTDMQGDPKTATTLNDQSLAILRPKLGADAQTIVDIEGNQASAYWSLGQFERSAGLYRQILAARLRNKGPDHPGTLLIQNDLETVLADQGKYEEAEQLAREVLARRLKLFGEQHPDIGYSLSNLGFVLLKTGRLAEAEQVQRRGLEIRRKVQGASHPDVTYSLNLLSWTLQELGQDQEALDLARESLAITLKALGPNHPRVAQTNDAAVLALLGLLRLSEAEELERQSVAIRRQTVPAKPHDVAQSLYNLGLVLHAKGDLESAEAAQREALKGRESFYGPGHDLTADSRQALAELLLDLQRRDEARTLLDQCLQVRRSIVKGPHPSTGRTLRALGRLELDSSSPGSALPLLTEALDMHRKTLPPDHRDIAISQLLLARARQSKADVAAARAALRRLQADYRIRRLL